MYSDLTFVVMYILHLWRFKIRRNWFSSFVGSSEFCANCYGSIERIKRVASSKETMLQRFIKFFQWTEQRFPETWLRACLLTGEVWLQLSELSNSYGVSELPERKDYRTIDVEFALVCPIQNQTIGYLETAALVNTNCLFSGLIFEMDRRY